MGEFFLKPAAPSHSNHGADHETLCMKHLIGSGSGGLSLVVVTNKALQSMHPFQLRRRKANCDLVEFDACFPRKARRSTGEAFYALSLIDKERPEQQDAC
jgi:hypothetical protein